MEWTKVDKDPPSKGIYLITDGKQFTPCEGWWSPENGWEVDRDARIAGFRDVTHWMPYPELPQEPWDAPTHAHLYPKRLLAKGITVDACDKGPPVVYMGMCDDQYYHFRAHEQRWRIAVADAADVAAVAESSIDRGVFFYADGRYGDEREKKNPMPLELAEAIIRQCVRVWRLSRQDD